MKSRYAIIVGAIFFGLGLFFSAPLAFSKTSGKSQIPKYMLKKSFLKKACGKNLSPYFSGKRVTYEGRLSKRVSLYAVKCFMAAYNGGTAYFAFNKNRPGKARQLTFQGYTEKGKKQRIKVLVNPYFIQKHKILDFFNKGRGLGDCGQLGRYKWTGNRFRLFLFKNEPDCNGKTSEFWPVLYPRKRKRQGR